MTMTNMLPMTKMSPSKLVSLPDAAAAHRRVRGKKAGRELSDGVRRMRIVHLYTSLYTCVRMSAHMYVHMHVHMRVHMSTTRPTW